MDSLPGHPLTRDQIVERLQEARSRTLLLVASLDDEDLRLQHDPLMSPIVWDLGHIGHFEEVWLIENLVETAGEAGGGSEGLSGMYDPFRNPRATRDALPLPSAEEARAFLGAIRGRVFEALGSLDLASHRPLLRDGFVFRMVLQHEYQHNETILQTLQLKRGRPYAPPRALSSASAPPPDADLAGMVRFPGGRVWIGTDDRSEAYDNERPAHTVTLQPFDIDRAPVTNGEFIRFMEDGGYQREEFWTPEGFRWIRDQGIEHPKYWSRAGKTDDARGEWITRRMDQTIPVPLDHPVCHVCYWEADAWARWAGKRLPTEIEWEAAARFDPETGTSLRFPWGEAPATPERANVDQLRFDTTPVGSYPRNVSPIGATGLIGDVWEWTSSDFAPWPGYETFPYPEYSEVFFGDEYKVLRGGSWATRSGAIRSTFRNWDYPIRRQIFSGFRCARDV